MRGCVVLFLCILISAGTTGQPPLSQIDSIQNLLGTEESPTRKVDLENRLASLYYDVDINKSLQFAQLALDQSKELKYDYGLLRAYSVLRRIHRRLGNFNVAIEYSLTNLTLLEELRDTTELLDAYATLGNNYSSLQNFGEANRYLFKAYHMATKVNAASLSGIMNFIGRSYGKMNMLDSGQYWIEKALAREKQYPQPGVGLYYIYNNLAEIHYLKKDYKKALEIYKTALALPDEKRNRMGETFSLNGMALVYNGLRQFDLAVAAANRNLELAKQNSFRDRVKEAYGTLHEIYEAKNDYQKALYFYKLYNLYQDSIFSEDKIKSIENLKFNYQTEKMEQENQLLKKDADLKDARLSEQRVLAWSSTLVALLLVVTLVFLFRSIQQKKNTNQMLAQYNHDLELQVDERTLELTKTNLELVRQNSQLEQFGYITAHNLRAPVARILGLTNVINSAAFEMPKDKHVLDKLQVSAQDLDTIIFDLNAILDIKQGVHNSFEEVSISARLEKAELALRDKIRDSNANIIHHLKAEACFGIPAYIESIFYNLISNAIKYRKLDQDPEIHISTSVEDHHVNLVVRDNGLGMDLDRLKDKVFNLYQRFHNHVEGKGLGLFLVKTQVEALNGTIQIESAVGIGTTISIRIPVAQRV